MHSTQSNSIFVRQNIWIKLIILILGSIASIGIPFKVLLYIFPVSCLYFLLSPLIYQDIFKGWRLFLPFFATYALFSTLLGVPFITMISFMVRVCIMIMYMVYFSASLSMPRLIEDCRVLLRYPLTRNVVFFFTATILFVRSMTKHYKSLNIKATRKFMNYTRIIPDLIDAIVINWQNKDIIEKEATEIIGKPYARVNFINKNNVAGCFFITLLVLFLSL